MQVSEAIQIIHTVYSQFHPSEFKQNVGSDSYYIWTKSKSDIIIFTEMVKPEHRTKFWIWLKQLGIQNIEQVRKIYGILNIIHSKINYLPPELLIFYLKFNNFYTFIGALDKNGIEKLITWSKIYSGYIVPRKVQYSVTRKIFIQPVVTRPTGQKIISKNLSQDRVRTIQELKNAFGEK